jgi:hypothetical protein
MEEQKPVTAYLLRPPAILHHYDNPLINSIGENILLRPLTGGIALMTTTRPVFAFSNRILNNNYL